MQFRAARQLLVAGCLVFSACGETLAKAVDADTQSVTIALTQEPPSLNSLLSTDIVSYFVLSHVNEGLVRYGRRGALVPGVAERWEIDEQGMTFYLRKDARWADGHPVTSSDFVFAWRKVNEPATAAPFAAIMHPILNAEKVQKGELPTEALGVTAVDAHTLRVNLERPCGYCISLMTHGTFFPIRAEFYDSAGALFGSEAKYLLANGPFQLKAWQHGASLVIEKNEHYWNANKIRLNRINVGYITEDNRARLNLFADGQIAMVRLGGRNREGRR